MWLLWHIEEFQNAEYPTSMTASPDWLPSVVGKVSKSGAYFETPMGILAELTLRLDKTKKDGKLLAALVTSIRDDTPDAFSQYYEYMDRDAKLALGYICGRKRKKTPYYSWRKQRVYRSMTTKR